MEVVKNNIRQTRETLYEHAIYLEFLRMSLIEELNHVNLKSAKKEASSCTHDSLFFIEAWAAKEKINEIIPMLDGLAIHFEEISIEKDDPIPTCMDNVKIGKMGEDLVHIYDTPSINDKDPSLWVFWSFTLFFSIIIADAGYGFLYLLLSLFLRWKFPVREGMIKRFDNLVTSLSIGCIVWGVLTSSFFGIELNPDNPLSKFSMVGYLIEKKAAYCLETQNSTWSEWIAQIPSLKSATTPQEFIENGVQLKEGKTIYAVATAFQDNIMLELSLIVGIFHVSLSFLRNLRRSWAGIGWVIFIFGGFFYFPSILQATSIINFMGWFPKAPAHEIGIQMLGFGAIVAIVLSFIQNRMGGLTEVMKVIEIFADILSYLRLYALGLASMIMASTFNDIGSSAGLFFGALILLVGHSVNITLGIMAGVIHGLRLNFLEWYHHSFEGGGRVFKPLKLLKWS